MFVKCAKVHPCKHKEINLYQHKYYTNNYTFMIQYVKKKKNKYYHKQINVFVVLAGKNGPAKQEQQKRLNAGQPNLSSLVLLLLCVRLNQPITPIQELLLAPLQYTKTDVSNTLFCHLLSGSLRCKK